MEQIKAMLEAMAKDTAFDEEMMMLLKGGNAEEVVAAAAKKGFVFTEADYQAYIDWGKTMSAKYESKELSPEELDKISGGIPVEKVGCWFHAASEPELINGEKRRRCNQLACVFVLARQMCGCHGTTYCVGGWHILPEASKDGCG